MKKATVDLFTRIFSVLAPPPNMTVSQWADKYRRLSSESSAEPGRWRTSKAPYQREIMDAVCDMRVQKVVIMSAAQIGKTDALILNPIGYYMHYDPSPIMVMQPTIQMAETFSKDRLSPMLRDTPVLRDKVNDKSRNSGNTILQKIFPGGHVTMVGANSPSSLASRPIRILLADEIDRYPATAGNEGDPLLLAGKRLATFWNKKEVCVSTPTNKETSRIAVEFEHSTQEEWNVPCPACGAFTPLLWANIVFDRDKLDEIGCTCPACGVVSSETEWKEQYINGKFVAAHPERKVRGFHLSLPRRRSRAELTSRTATTTRRRAVRATLERAHMRAQAMTAATMTLTRPLTSCSLRRSKGGNTMYEIQKDQSVPVKFFAGEYPVVTAVKAVATGKSVKQYEPVKLTDNGIEPVVKVAASEAVSGTSTPAKSEYENTTAGIYGIAATAAQAAEEVVVYLTGEFFADAITLPEGVTADTLAKAFRNIGIFLK